eukprot:GFUD01129558.1.p1 GENE.GFUD01129558.1~~GFUD01129558.1.p1  ORF type:complete len:145 (+),score=30.94 GFUD01129558.1:412-846(+)
MQHLKMFCQVFLAVLIAGSVRGAPSSSAQGGHHMVQRESQNSCENHPCGWIRYHDGNWNSYSAYDVTENTFCPCPSTQRCRYSDTRTALDLHRFTCQAEGSTNTLFPSTTSRRRRRAVTTSADMSSVFNVWSSPQLDVQDVQFS